MDYFEDILSNNLTFLGIFFLLMFGIIIYGKLRKRKLKKLKYEGTGILKKTKIDNVIRIYNSGDDNSSGYYEYWLESKDEEGNNYRSNSYKNLEHGGRTIEEMKRIYNGVEYDLTKKDSAIKQINENISRIECELSNDPGFFKKRKLRMELDSMEEYLQIANEGPINPYIVIKGHKIGIGDLIDVYVDPNNFKNYYFDLDFTKEKY